jgi:ribonucleotide reductase beta subunit family protein with ferritin-like domain
MSLIEPSKAYKPFKYPQAYQFWKRQQELHWLPTEVPMGQDVKDWPTISGGRHRRPQQLSRRLSTDLQAD